MKIRRKTLCKYQRYFELGRTEPRRLDCITVSADGVSAVESFHSFESVGKLLSTREPRELEAYLTGKEIHGMTVAMVAEDFAINRVVCGEEIKANYPKWVANEIVQAAKRIAINRIGFIPTFIGGAELS